MPATSHEAITRKRIRAYERHKEKLKDPEYRLAYNRKRTSRRKANNPTKFRLNGLKSSAKSRGIEFTLSVDDLHIPAVCPVFNTPFVDGDKDYAPSVDRIDNSKGYVKDNVWVISRRANRIKNDASLEELEAIVRALKAK